MVLAQRLKELVTPVMVNLHNIIYYQKENYTELLLARQNLRGYDPQGREKWAGGLGPQNVSMQNHCVELGP